MFCILSRKAAVSSTKLEVFRFVHHTHAPTAELLDNAVVRDGLPYHVQECYGGSFGKSMKAVELARISEGLLAINRGYSAPG
jgi:hypothetical protein